MSDPMEDKRLERDRVRKVAEKWLDSQPYTEEGELTLYDIDKASLTSLILKEIKRAERREREACAKVAGTHLLGEGILTYTPLTLRIKITNAIRNRRTT